MSENYGYIRVSSRDQNLDRQIEAMRRLQIPVKNIYRDQLSGKDFKRAGYQKLLKKLKREDVLYILSIDRLGRDYEEILEQWRYLTHVKYIHIVVIDQPLLDTRTQANGLTGKFISDIVLQILSYVAQNERENILGRQKEGILLAKKKGVQFGRPTKERPKEFEQLYTMWKQGKISLRKGAKALHIHHATFSKWIREYEDSEQVVKN